MKVFFRLSVVRRMARSQGPLKDSGLVIVAVVGCHFLQQAQNTRNISQKEFQGYVFSDTLYTCQVKSLFIFLLQILKVLTISTLAMNRC